MPAGGAGYNAGMDAPGATVVLGVLFACGCLARAGAPAPSPDDPAQAWEMTSGELRRYAGAFPASGGTEAPARVLGSDSRVFRMRSRSAGFGDVELSLRLLNERLVTRRGPAWDGVHLWLRYQDPAHLYAVSVNRRDDRVVIKKKIPGGRSYGGSYFDLCAAEAYRVPYGAWQTVSASARNNADGSVTLALRVDGRLLLEATDDGRVGGPPIRAPGRVGVRGDNAAFRFQVLALRQAFANSSRDR